MVFKRSRPMESGDLDVMTSLDAMTSPEAANKRLHAAPGPVCPSQPALDQELQGAALAFLRDLVATGYRAQDPNPLGALLPWGSWGVNPAGPGRVCEEHWLCCAELNLLLERYFKSLPAASLRSYHSFIRQEPGQLCLRLSQALAPRGTTPDGDVPVHVQMLSQLLGVLPYSSLGAVLYRFAKPPWMFGWSSKWRHCQPEMALVELQCYPLPPGLPVGNTPARVIYIPVFA